VLLLCIIAIQVACLPGYLTTYLLSFWSWLQVGAGKGTIHGSSFDISVLPSCYSLYWFFFFLKVPLFNYYLFTLSATWFFDCMAGRHVYRFLFAQELPLRWRQGTELNKVTYRFTLWSHILHTFLDISFTFIFMNFFEWRAPLLAHLSFPFKHYIVDGLHWKYNVHFFSLKGTIHANKTMPIIQ